MPESKTITMTLQFRVRETDARIGGSADWLAKAIGEYVTFEENPLRADYGPDADGGYDGCYITSARVVAVSIESQASIRERNRPRN